MMEMIEPVLNEIGLFLNGMGFNVLFGLIVIACIINFIIISTKSSKHAELFIIDKPVLEENDESKKRVKSKNPISNLRSKIDFMFVFKPNEKRANLIFSGILIGEVLLLLFFVFTHKYLLAIVIPLTLHFLAVKAIDIWTESINEYIQKDLPIAIKHFIKVMTRTGDLKLILYETGKHLREPLRTEFLNASRRMATENQEDVLMDLADRLKNTWIHAFVFILVSYRESSRKEDVMRNLALLASMIEEENRLAEKAVTEKKGVVILNYLLITMSLVAFVGNLIWNPDAYYFFFKSVVGMIALLFGFVALGLTVIVNFMLSKRAF